jgi:hypothetical protein
MATEKCAAKMGSLMCEREEDHRGKHMYEDDALGQVFWGRVEYDVAEEQFSEMINRHKARMEQQRNNVLAATGLVVGIVCLFIVLMVASAVLV